MLPAPNEMVERVAKAIEDKMASDDNMPEDLARAAIAVMYEPTPEMIRAGLRTRPTVMETWHTMIDAALAEKVAK